MPHHAKTAKKRPKGQIELSIVMGPRSQRHRDENSFWYPEDVGAEQDREVVPQVMATEL